MTYKEDAVHKGISRYTVSDAPLIDQPGAICQARCGQYGIAAVDLIAMASRFSGVKARWRVSSLCALWFFQSLQEASAQAHSCADIARTLAAEVVLDPWGPHPSTRGDVMLLDATALSAERRDVSNFARSSVVVLV